MITLTKQHIEIFNNYLGYGNYKNSNIIFLGNELGVANNSNGRTPISMCNHIKEYLKNKSYHKIGNGFILNEIEYLPIKSTFLQFIYKFIILSKNNNLKDINKEIDLCDFEKVLKNECCICNLKPLPLKSERKWDYKNISEKEYSKLYNFISKSFKINNLNKIRIENFKELLRNNIKIIIGIGDRKNKKAFFEKIFNINLTELILENKYKIYYNKEYKILLSNYWDNMSGLGINGIIAIYKFLKYEKLI